MKWGKGKGNKRQETNHIKSSKKYEYAAISSYERWEIQEKKRKWNQRKERHYKHWPWKFVKSMMKISRTLCIWEGVEGQGEIPDE